MKPPEAEYPAELYAALHKGNAGDLDFYLAQTEGAAQILELGCGYGRVLAALAARGGAELTGVDLHPGLLARCRARLGDRARLIEADMRNLSLPERFDAVLIPYSGFLCLLTDRDAQATLQVARRQLRPGGRLLFDLYIPPEEWREVISVDDPEHEDELGRIELSGAPYELFECSRWEPARQRMDVVYRHEPIPAGPARYGRIRQRYLFPEQVTALCREAGFEVELWPDFLPTGDPVRGRVLAVIATRSAEP